jgi:hypothetical protein
MRADFTIVFLKTSNKSIRPESMKPFLALSLKMNGRSGSAALASIRATGYNELAVLERFRARSFGRPDGLARAGLEWIGNQWLVAAPSMRRDLNPPRRRPRVDHAPALAPALVLRRLDRRAGIMLVRGTRPGRNRANPPRSPIPGRGSPSAFRKSWPTLDSALAAPVRS